ncbi:917_t:CDS:1, partial [Ambispora leptoticha]
KYRYNAKNNIMEDLKHTFSIQLPISLYQKIVNEAGKGKVSTFIREILEEKFVEKTSCLGNAYKECYANNPHLLEEAKL